jgi:hypothetical protein
MNDKLIVTGVIATTEPTQKYRGVRLAPRVLEQIRDGILSGDMPLQMQHDSFRRFDAEILRVWIEDTKDGEKELRFQLAVEPAVYESAQAEFAAAGGPGGFSFSAAERQAELDAVEGDDRAGVIALAADAGAWDDDARLVAAQSLRRIGRVEVNRFYEFGVADVAKVVLELPSEIWDELLLGVSSGLVSEAITSLVRRRREPSIIELRSEPATGKVIARVETDDPAMAEAAIRGLRKQADEAGQPGGGNFAFDLKRELWLPKDSREGGG